MTNLFTWRETLAFTYDRPFHMTRNIGVYIRPTFSHDANTYQIACESNRAIWENLVTRNCVLEFWLMTELSEIKPILQWALDNVNNVKISDLLVFVVILLLFSIYHLKIASGGGIYFLKVARLGKHPQGTFFDNNFKKSLAELSFYFYLQIRKTATFLWEYS